MPNIVEERMADYGDPLDTHEALGQVWGAMLTRMKWSEGRPLLASEAALMMAGLKLVRLCFNPDHTDSYEDLIQYAKIAQRIRGAGAPPSPKPQQAEGLKFPERA